MFRLALCLLLGVSTCCPSLSLAQDSSDEPTLPEVVVEPESQDESLGLPDATPGAGTAAGAVEPAIPSTTATNVPPTTSQTGTPASAFDLPESYPDLSELSFGGPGGSVSTTGILRSEKSLFDAPLAGSITTRQDIMESQSADMFQALQNEVGVLMQSTAAGQASPFVRGVTGQQVLILIDGIRLNNSTFRFGPNQYFNTIDPGMVDRIEVARGQGSVLWGSDAIGGAINVVTRGPDMQYGSCHGDCFSHEFTQTFNTANSSPYTRVNAEGWAGKTSFFTGGSFLNVRNLDTGFDFGRQPGTNYQQHAGDMKLNYLLDDSSLLTVSFQHVEQEGLPRSDRFPGYPGDLNNSNSIGGARFFDPQQRDLAYIRYQVLDPNPWVDAFTFTASYHRQREIQTRGIPSTRFQETDVQTVGLSMLVAKELGAFGKITTGVDWYHDDVDSAFGGSASGPIIPDDAYYERFGCFLNWDVALTDRLDATAGVRYENIDLAATPIVNGNSVFITPHYDDWVSQIGLVYELNPYMNLVGSVSEGFRAPNLDELTANNPNVLQQGRDLPSLGLIPERSVSYDVGIKTNYRRLRTQLFVYWMDLQNNIVPVVAGANQFTRDNQDSFIQGTELDAEYLLQRGWSLFGNMTYTYGRNEITQAPLSRIPPTQGVAGIRWRDRKARNYFSIYTWMVRRQDRLDPVRDIGDERIPASGTPGFATLNMRFGKTLGCCNRHRLSLNLDNITDKAYLVHGSGVFGTGFTARFGYSWVY